MLFCHLQIFLNIFSSKNIREYQSVSSSLDQSGHYVRPGSGSKLFAKVSNSDTSYPQRGRRVNDMTRIMHEVFLEYVFPA